jgi:hypothetical protein
MSYVDSIHRVEYLDNQTLLLTRVNGEPLEIVMPNVVESPQRVRAHIAAPVPLSTALVYIPWGAIDDNPSDWVYTGGANREFVIPDDEDGQYDIFFQGMLSASGNIQTVFLYRAPLVGVAEYLGGPQAVVGNSLLQGGCFDQTLLAGDKINVLIQSSAGTPSLNSARLSIIKRGDPFV